MDAPISPIKNSSLYTCDGLMTKWKPNEEFAGFYEIPNTNAVTIATVIKDAMFRIRLPLRSCHGQCYDGARPMAGIKNGLGVIIQWEVPTAHLTYCPAMVTL